MFMLFLTELLFCHSGHVQIQGLTSPLQKLGNVRLTSAAVKLISLQNWFGDSYINQQILVEYACKHLFFQGAHVIDEVTTKAKTYDWFQSIYLGLDGLSNDATMNMTGNEVIR